MYYGIFSATLNISNYFIPNPNNICFCMPALGNIRTFCLKELAPTLELTLNTDQQDVMPRSRAMYRLTVKRC